MEQTHMVSKPVSLTFWVLGTWYGLETGLPLWALQVLGLAALLPTSLIILLVLSASHETPD